jgi:hypothetical protein
MDLLRRWRREAPGGVYALYEDGERVGPLPVIYSHYRRGFHLWEVLVPAENATRMRGLRVDSLPARTQLHGTLSDAVDPYQWHAEEGN